MRKGLTGRVKVSRRAGFDPFSPSVESRARRGLSRPLSGMLGFVKQSRHQNGPMPRRNNARKGQGQQTGADHRVTGLGSHWRADGLMKTSYATQSDALTAAFVRRQESGVELNVYRCDVCSGWHMGNPPGGKSSGRIQT